MNTIRKLEMTSTSEHERQLTVTIADSMVNQEFSKALQSMQRVATRPGFRPGKMPTNMVLNFYGPKIKQQLVETLIEKSFDAACKEKEIIPVSQPRLEPLGEVSQNQPFTYKALFQVKPKLETPEHKGLTVELKKVTFSDADVEGELNNLRESMATFVQAQDRDTIGENDLVECDSIVKVDGIENPNYSHKDYSVPLFAENVPNDLKNALIGKKVSETVSVDYTMPSDHQDPEISGKKCTMELSIKSFKERQLPALDDEFAKDLSKEFQKLDDVKESIRLRFNITAKRRNEYYKQEAITKALIDKNPIEVPSALVERMGMSMINRELENMDEKVAKNLVQNHWQEMWKSVKDRAEFRVKAELLFESLIESLNIAVSEEELAHKIKTVKKISKDDARYSVQVEKLLDVIESEATITTTEEPLFQKGE